ARAGQRAPARRAGRPAVGLDRTGVAGRAPGARPHGGARRLALPPPPPAVLCGRRAAWTVPAWLAGLLALGLTEVRGAWLGFAAGCAACTLGLRRRWLVLGAPGLVVARGLPVEARLPERVES